MNDVRTAWWVAACAVALVLTGCRSAATRIFTLEPTAPASNIDVYRAPPLRVARLNVPASWDRIEILKQSAAGALQIGDFDHWAAPLPQMARQTLSDDLDRRLPLGSVVYPGLPRTSGALDVSVDILEFNILASQASMRVSWDIVSSEDSHSAKRSTAELRSPMSSEEPAAIARAWSELIGQLADRIAADAISFSIP